MSNLVKKMEKVAKGIADANPEENAEIAKELNKISSEVKRVKTAQYVGVQGYWIKNRRCWDNCYRQKRAKNKSYSAQEAWNECHSEYLGSINADESEWEKYAKQEDQKEIKTAKNTESLDRVFDRFFSKFSQKFPTDLAVDMSIAAGQAFVKARTEKSIADRFSKQSKKLSELAKTAKRNHNEDLYDFLKAASKELEKEAQGLRGMIDKGKRGLQRLWSGDAAPLEAVKNSAQQVLNLTQQYNNAKNQGNTQAAQQLVGQWQQAVESLKNTIRSNSDAVAGQLQGVAGKNNLMQAMTNAYQSDAPKELINAARGLVQQTTALEGKAGSQKGPGVWEQAKEKGQQAKDWISQKMEDAKSGQPEDDVRSKFEELYNLFQGDKAAQQAIQKLYNRALKRG